MFSLLDVSLLTDKTGARKKYIVIWSTATFYHIAKMICRKIISLLRMYFFYCMKYLMDSYKIILSHYLTHYFKSLMDRSFDYLSLTIVCGIQAESFFLFIQHKLYYRLLSLKPKGNRTESFEYHF